MSTKAQIAFQSAEWRAKILDPMTAIRWTLKIGEDDEMSDAVWFLRRWNEGAVFGAIDGEYRYWATGTHEPEDAGD